MGFSGREIDAITLHTSSELASLGRTCAMTENFLPMEIEGRLPANLLIRVRVTGLTLEGALRATAEVEISQVQPAAACS